MLCGQYPRASRAPWTVSRLRIKGSLNPSSQVPGLKFSLEFRISSCRIYTGLQLLNELYPNP